MAASFVIAGRNNGFARADARAAALASVTAYRKAMAGFAQLPTMAIWYAHMPEDQLVTFVQNAVAEVAKEEKKARKAKKTKAQPDGREEEAAREVARRAQKNIAKAHTRDSAEWLSRHRVTCRNSPTAG